MSNNNNSTQVSGTNTGETVAGTAANEKVDAKPGADAGLGGAGDDWVKGGQGDDTVDGGAGSDRVDGNAGNDRLLYTVGENAGSKDVYDGGAGTNTLVLKMTRAEWMRDGIQADIAALLAFLASPAANATGALSSSGFTFSSIGLNVKRITTLEVFVDGVALDPRDEAIVATADAQTTATEHSVVSGNVAGNDMIPDLLRSVDLVTGPAKGSLTLLNDGNYVYDPGMAFDSLAVGETATTGFTYRITDADRDSATATNTITVTGTNDAPVAVADVATTPENTVLTVDVLANDTDVDTSDMHIVDSVTITSTAAAGGLVESKAGELPAGGQGSVAIVGNKLQWTPGTDFDYLAPGDTAVVTMAYTQNDANAGTSGSTLAITVTGVNDAPVVQFPLGALASEQDAPFTIDLLQGASDVDRGAILNAVTLAEPGGKGGWVLEGNTLKIDPDHFDRLNEGDTANLTFNYKVRDQYGGEVAQTLQVDIEGFTDAPWLDARASAGAKVNEVKLVITSQPAYDENVLLTFSNVPSGAKVLNAQGADVTATGVNGFIGTHDFSLVLPSGADADFDLGITVSGLEPDGEVIGYRVGAIDIVYDRNSVQDDVTFIARNEGMWDSGPAPMVQWHEYIPLVGTKSQRWDKIEEEWVDTGSGAWRSGKFKLFGAQVDAQEAKDIALGVANATLDTARTVFETTSKIVDAVAQGIYDTAVTAYNKASSDALAAFNTAADAAQKVFDDVITGAKKLLSDAAWGAYNLAEVAADLLRDGVIAIVHASPDLVKLANDAYNETMRLAGEARDGLLGAIDATIAGTRALAQETLDGARASAQWIKDQADASANGLFNLAKEAYDVAKQKAWNAANNVLDGAKQVFNDIASELTKVSGKTALDVNADLYADIGVQVDFILDSGSVDADVNYELTSVLQHNRTTDTLVITPHLTNTTTGQSVAFDTISPNASLKAVLLYDVGIDLEVVLDSYLTVAGVTIWDLSPNANGVSNTTSMTTGGWGAEFETFRAGMESLSGSINFDSIAVGSIDLLNLSTTDVKDIEVPLVGLLTEEIATVYVGIPTVVAEGKAAAWNPNQFVEGGLIGVDLSVITDAILNLLTARIDFSPELRAQLPHLPSLHDSPSLLAAVNAIGTAFLGTLFEALDGQSESTPIFLLDATEEINPANLIHANLWPDFVIGSTVTPNTAKFGFWKGFGKSNDLVRVVIDIDQAVAVVVNKIIEVAAAVGTSGSTLQFLAKLPDINPLDLEFGLEELLHVVEAPQATIDEITKFLDLSIGFETADVDVYSSVRFSQEFTLTVDDMLYLVTMEDGEKYLFEANADGALKIENASRHDANSDGTVEYAMELVPKAMFSNDTELGLTVGYVLDYLQATFSADLKLPIDDLLNINIPGLPDIKLNLADVALGPLLRVQGDLDISSADVFEKRFEFELESDDVSGDYSLPETELVTVIGVDNTIVVS